MRRARLSALSRKWTPSLLLAVTEFQADAVMGPSSAGALALNPVPVSPWNSRWDARSLLEARRGRCADRCGFGAERGCGKVSSLLRGGWLLTHPRGGREWGLSAVKVLLQISGVEKRKGASASAQLLSCITFPLERCYNSNSITVNSAHHLHSWKIL